MKSLPRSDHFGRAPLQVGQKRPLERPRVRRVERIRLLDARGLQRPAHRLEIGLAVLLDQGLEERHAEHLTLSFIDARGKILMNVLSEQVAPKERPASVGLHEELDRRLFLRLAAEDLGDDAFELTAVALIEQPRAPIDERIATDDERRQAADSPQDQLASGDGGTVGPAELGPGKQIGEHDPHRARGRCAQGDSAQIQPVIGDRQPIALVRHQQVFTGDAQAVEFEPVVMQSLEREETVLHELELLVFVVGQIDDQDRGLFFDPAHQADWCGPARHW